MKYIQVFFEYILPVLAVTSFGFLIYLLTTRKTYFSDIEELFEESINHNKQLSQETIINHFENMQHLSKEALENFNDEAKKQLDKTLRKIEDLGKKQELITRYLDEQQKIIEDLNSQIKKRDAIIERKTKQVKRLKSEI